MSDSRFVNSLIFHKSCFESDLTGVKDGDKIAIKKLINSSLETSEKDKTRVDKTTLETSEVHQLSGSWLDLQKKLSILKTEKFSKIMSD
jgi:hypothetical protein